MHCHRNPVTVIQQLEDIAMERALYGQEVPVYSYGKLIGSRIVHNDRLLMFMLRNRAPTRFGADGRAASRQNAIGNPLKAAELNRLKKQWRKEWEEERQREESEESCLEALDAQIDRMRSNWLASMTSRTRALYEAWRAAEAEDKAAGRTAWDEQEDADDDEEESDAEWEARALPGPRKEPDWREG